MHINAKSQRGMIWAFMLMSTLYSVAYWKLLKFFPPVPANLDPAAIAKLYSENNMEFRAGVVIMMLSAGFYIPLTVVISAHLARLEKGYPLWSKMQLIAGMLGTWLFAFPPFMWGVCAFTAERDPALTSILHEIAWLCFVTPPSYFALQMFPIAIVAISKDNRPDSPFPRWFGYLSFWEGVAGTFGVAAMLLKTGPFAWNGWFAFYLPLFTFAIWLSCLFPLLFRAIKQQQAAEQG